MLTHSFLLASLVVGYSRAIDLDTSNNGRQRWPPPLSSTSRPLFKFHISAPASPTLTPHAGSIKAAAQIVASNILEFYPNNPNGTAPGIASQPGADAPIGTFDSPYYWWEAGAVWNGLLDYWAVTGDAQYNSLVMQALLFQTGPNFDYMPTNQSKSEGNDDQGVWALAALTAAELALPMAASSHVSWTDLAVTVFNDQVKRWDTTTCSGGLRWQIFAFNAGYNYKNSMSQGTFFQLAARLAVLTGNSTYADWATKVWDWTSDVGMLESGTKGTMLVYDGTVDTANCTQIDKLQWSMSTGLFLEGSVAMWQFTNVSRAFSSSIQPKPTLLINPNTVHNMVRPNHRSPLHRRIHLRPPPVVLFLLQLRRRQHLRRSENTPRRVGLPSRRDLQHRPTRLPLLPRPRSSLSCSRRSRR